MGVALPLALLGLFGVALPLWIHRVRRRTLRELALPTIALLERALSKKRRALSFRDRPLLYTRIALVALFALSLARPYLSRVASYATERPIAIAIVIDDSMSMQQKGRLGGTLFEAARARAERVLSELVPDSEAVVVLGGNEPRVLGTRTADTLGLRTRVSKLDPSGARGTALGQALSLALRELTGTKLPSREALVLTDCDAHAAVDTLDSRGAHLRVECIEARGGRGNAYIASAAFSRGSVTRELPPSLVLDLVSPADVRELEVAVRIDGKPAAEASVPMVDGRGSMDVSLSPEQVAAGRVLDARITTANALPDDDVREIDLDASAELSVLLVDGDPAPNQLDDELRFASLALSLDSYGRGAPRVTRVDESGLPGVDLTGFDVVVLANVRAPSEQEAKRIERFVSGGGGLLISAGEHVDAFQYRGRFAEMLPALPRSSAPSRSTLTLSTGGEPDELLPEAGRGLETARTLERLLVEPPTPPHRTVLAYSDGTPAIVAGTYGTGKVALLTTTLDDDWTDLPLTPGFLPLLHGLVRGLSALDALPKGPIPAGKVLTARIPLGARSLYLVTPDGRRVDIDTKKPSVRIDDTGVVGVYRAFGQVDERAEHELDQLSFTIVPDTHDSDLTVRRPKAEMARPTEGGGAGRPKGVEPWFWLALGLAAAGEGFLRLFTRKPGAQPAAA